MSPRELRASLSLAAIFGLRLFGMFVILPVFALWAEGRPGWNLTLVGIALGVYGLTQALLQIPFGYWSDRAGRKPVLYVGLAIMASGSFVAAGFESPWMVIVGRMLQGAGAVSAVAIAMAGDLTRDSQRTKAMAIIGSSIGGAFALSFVLAPFLEHAIGVRGLFAMTGVFCILAIGVVAWIVPDVEGKPAERQKADLRAVLRDAELVRINIGIFILRMVLMAVFVVVPTSLVASGAPAKDHWWVYLVGVGCGMVLMLPVVMGRVGHRERPVVLGAIATLAVAVAGLAASQGYLPGLVASLVVFFAGFNALEAKLPALVSRAVPSGARGLATGIFSSTQFLGMFAGGSLGGFLAQRSGLFAVLGTCFAALVVWFLVASRMGNFTPATLREDTEALAEAEASSGISRR